MRPPPASLRPLLLGAGALVAGRFLAGPPSTLRLISDLGSGDHHAQRQNPPSSSGFDDSNDTPLPLVVWHGLGDTSRSEGMERVRALAEAVHPGTFVYSVVLDADADADRSASFLGNVTVQLASVCAALAAHPVLSAAPAVDALGFSQGGQFLRAYIERCNNPPVRSLVTFGSQHNGIIEFRACAPADWLCRGAMLLLHFNVWSPLVQSRLVPAQYFRNPADYQPYLESSNFLADINNERPRKNATYRRNIAALANFIMYMFDDDTTVIPKQTSWFQEVNGTDVIPLRRRRLYEEDWLGLRELDNRGGLQFRSIAGDHLQIPGQVLNDTMAEFFGPFNKTFDGRAGVSFDEL